VVNCTRRRCSVFRPLGACLADNCDQVHIRYARSTCSCPIIETGVLIECAPAAAYMLYHFLHQRCNPTHAAVVRWHDLYRFTKDPEGLIQLNREKEQSTREPLLPSARKFWLRCLLSPFTHLMTYFTQTPTKAMFLCFLCSLGNVIWGMALSREYCTPLSNPSREQINWPLHTIAEEHHNSHLLS
jgi:hypothetical protein